MRISRLIAHQSYPTATLAGKIAGKDGWLVIAALRSFKYSSIFYFNILEWVTLEFTIKTPKRHQKLSIRRSVKGQQKK